MKKILVGLTVMALALMAAPALAVQPCQGPHCGGSNNGGLDISIDNDDTNVGNTVTVKADTGDNEIKGEKQGGFPFGFGFGGSSKGGKIITGDAGVQVDTLNDVNSSAIKVILKGISRVR
jgi:hypothetical protein